MITISQLFALHAAMAEEHKQWGERPRQGGHQAYRRGRHEFTDYQFQDYNEARAFIQINCVRAGLQAIGFEVEELTKKGTKR